jgi:hypothetical protein
MPLDPRGHGAPRGVRGRARRRQKGPRSGVLGAVGSIAAQLARWGGATVIGTVRRGGDLDQVDPASRIPSLWMTSQVKPSTPTRPRACTTSSRSRSPTTPIWTPSSPRPRRSSPPTLVRQAREQLYGTASRLLELAPESNLGHESGHEVASGGQTRRQTRGPATRNPRDCRRIPEWRDPDSNRSGRRPRSRAWTPSPRASGETRTRTGDTTIFRQAGLTDRCGESPATRPDRPDPGGNQRIPLFAKVSPRCRPRRHRRGPRGLSPMPSRRSPRCASPSADRRAVSADSAFGL